MVTGRRVAIAIGVPLLLLAAIVLGTEQVETRWRAEIVAQLGPQPAARLEGLRLEHLCRDDPSAQAAIPELCRDITAGLTLRWVAIANVAGSAFLLGLIWWSVRYAGRDRARMSRVFGPGLATIEVGLVALILMEGASGTGGAYLLEVGFLDAFHPQLIGGIALAALLAAIAVVRAVLTVRRGEPVTVRGLAVGRADEPRLFEFVDDVAAAVGTTGPDVVIAGLDPTFFVIEHDVRLFDGRVRGKLLYLSLPLSRILSRDELRAVVGHEMGHFKGADTLYSQRFAPIYRSATAAFGAVAAHARGIGRLVLAPSLELLGGFLEGFATTERAVSRERELEADLVGAAVASPAAIATSLIKLHAYEGLWTEVLRGTARDIAHGRAAPNPSTAFAKRAAAGLSGQRLQDLEGVAVPHPVDSHPRLSVRLAHLGIPYEAAAAAALTGTPVDSGISLLARPEDIEGRLLEALRDELERAPGGQTRLADPEERLRDAAAHDEVIAAVVSLFDDARSGRLGRPLELQRSWRALAPIELQAHPDPRPFISTVPITELPAGDQLLARRIAPSSAVEEAVIPVGAALEPVGINGEEERRDGYHEDVYTWDGHLVVVQDVGTGDLEAQLAGLWVVPTSEPLANPDGPFGDEVRRLRALLMDRANQVSNPVPVSEATLAPSVTEEEAARGSTGPVA